jgi:outer membrane protein TolC
MPIQEPGESFLMSHRPLLRPALLPLAAALALLASAALAARDVPLPESSAHVWVPAERDRLPPFPPTATDDEIQLQPGTKVSLGDILDLALRRSPRTRATWLAARAAADELGVRRAELYPTLDLTGTWTRAKSSQVGGTGFAFLRDTYGPGASLSWLLFDFGGRSGDLGDARYALLAADWTHNAEIQAVVLAVQQAYYRYLGAAAARGALVDSIRQAESNLQAAEERRAAGVATIADVLQARTALAQERFDLARVDGDMRSIKGALATAIGVRPDIDVEVEELPAELAGEPTSREIGQLLEQALADRPDLAAARAEALAAHQRVRKESSDGLPTVGLSATGNRIDVDGSDRPAAESYQVQLALRVPLFDGFERRYRVAQAKAEAEQQEAFVERFSQQVMLEVWTAYYALESAGQQVAAGRTLLDSASQSADVAGARYRAGAGSILDLLAAQSALADARAQEIQARAAWFEALAQLQHDIGRLDLTAAPATSESEGTP